MKTTILFFLLSIFAIYGKSQSSVEIYNNTDKKLSIAYVFYDFDNKCWTSKGWYQIEKYSTQTIFLGNYKGKIYLHAEYEGIFTYSRWGSGYSFCIDPKNAFEIRDADKVNCNKKREFSEKAISYGKNNYTFIP